MPQASKQVHYRKRSPSLIFFGGRGGQELTQTAYSAGSRAFPKRQSVCWRIKREKIGQVCAFTYKGTWVSSESQVLTYLLNSFSVIIVP